MTGRKWTERIMCDWVTCKDGPWYPNLSHGGYTHYRIWIGDNGIAYYQRHEWKRVDGSIEMQDWIPTYGGSKAKTIIAN